MNWERCIRWLGKPTNATGTFTTDDIEVNYYYQPKQVDVITSW